VESVVQQLTLFGLPLVLAVAFAEQIGMPVPAIPVLAVAGALAADGRLPLVAVLVLATAGALAADLTWFAVGRRYGHRVLHTVCRISLSPDACVRRTEDFFERAGMPSLLVAKFLPGYSLVAPPLAGSLGAPLAAFALWDLAGTVLWVGVAVGAGFLFHEVVDEALAVLARMGGWAFAMLASGLALFILVRWQRRLALGRLLGMERISAAELRALAVAGADPLILDVRGETQRRLEPRRIPGARAVPLDRLAAELAAVPRDREVITYCA